jgi:hypothetical protein
VNTESTHIAIREGVMPLVCLGSIPLSFILLVGCAQHGLRCDAHLTPINPPAPPAAAIDVKPPETGSP